jgi:pimeloyl-ACP methyl ester carboxylesterase
VPVTKIRGANINYEIVGSDGPWIALITGGRRAYNEFVPLATKIAKGGYRVLLHDRRNTGASDILFDSDEVEEATWADDLAVLLSQLQAAPAFIGGSSAGARTAILFALRHAAAVRALLLLRVTGGAFAAARLPENYYDQYIRAAEQGGMAAVCATEQYAERIAANPGNRARLMSMDPKRYIAVMRRWRELFVAGAQLPVMGVTDAELNSIKVPTIIIPGNDKTHASASALAAHERIRGSEIHQLPITEQDVPLVPFTDWAPHEEEIARVFVEFMQRAAAAERAPAARRASGAPALGAMP